MASDPLLAVLAHMNAKIIADYEAGCIGGEEVGRILESLPALVRLIECGDYAASSCASETDSKNWWAARSAVQAAITGESKP